MSEERHEIRCDVCKRWVPLGSDWEGCTSPEGWLIVTVCREKDTDSSFQICSRMCLLRWAVFHGH